MLEEAEDNRRVDHEAAEVVGEEVVGVGQEEEELVVLEEAEEDQWVGHAATFVGDGRGEEEAEAEEGEWRHLLPHQPQGHAFVSCTSATLLGAAKHPGDGFVREPIIVIKSVNNTCYK